MGALDFLRAAIMPAAAARSGYLQGQTEETDKQTALARQSRMDAMKQRLDEAAAERDEGEARWYNQRPTTPTTAAPPPHTVNAAEGIMQWDPATKTFKPTGLHPHQPRLPASEQPDVVKRREAREQRMETQGALSGVERQISDTRQEAKDLPTDPSIASDADLTTRMGRLRSRLDSLGHVSDSLNGAMKAQRGGAGMTANAPAARRALPLSPAAASDPAQSDYEIAAQTYKEALQEATSPEERADAADEYRKARARLAKKHGTTP